MPGRTCAAVIVSFGTGASSYPSSPNRAFTGLFTVAPSCGSTKYTRRVGAAGAGAGAGAAAGGASAGGCAGSEPPQALAATTNAKLKKRNFCIVDLSFGQELKSCATV